MVRSLLLLGVPVIAPTAVYAQDKPYNPYALLQNNYWQGNNLFGVARVMRAQGQAAVDFATAKSINEKTKQEAIITKQKEVEHTNWMLRYKPYEADFETRRQEESYRMQMIAAKPGEILSGYALNTLRKRMEAQYTLLDSDSTPLPELLRNGGLAKRINFTDGARNASSGLLLLEKLSWRGLLQEEAFAADRTAVESLLAQALETAERGYPTFEIQKKLKQHLLRMKGRRVTMMQSDMKNHCFEMYPHMYADQQLGQLEQTINMLDRLDLTETIRLKKNIDAPTIGKLVAVLRERGWEFAGSSDGNEAVYTALYKAMKEAIERGNFR